MNLQEIETDFVQLEDQLSLLEKLSDMELTVSEIDRFLALLTSFENKKYPDRLSDSDAHKYADRMFALSARLRVLIARNR